MAKHLVKCKICGMIFDASIEPFVKVSSNRYAHEACAIGAEAAKSKEEKDKEELIAYIKQLFECDTISPKINKQIQDYKSKYNYSYSGIRKTLKYFFEVKGNSLEKANGGIGIVPFVYNDAFLYWRALWEVQQKNEQSVGQTIVAPVQEIHITSPERTPYRPRRKLFTFLDEVEGSN